MLFAATSRNAPELLAVLLAAALAAACGGRGGVLHDVLDEAEERVNLLLEGFEDAEDEMNEAIVLHLEKTHNLMEHAGAASLAAALKIRERLAGKRVVLVASGGNISLDHLRAALDHGRRDS